MNTLQVVCEHGKVLWSRGTDTHFTADAAVLDQKCNCTPEPCEACRQREPIQDHPVIGRANTVQAMSPAEMAIRWVLKQHCTCGGAK